MQVSRDGAMMYVSNAHDYIFKDKSGAMVNVRAAMRNAGYADTAWTLLVQTYSSPIPRGAREV